MCEDELEEDDERPPAWAEALEERLVSAGVTELWDPVRPSVIRPKRRGFDWKRLLGRPM